MWIAEIFEYLKNNYPELEIRLFNCGISGSQGRYANLKDRMYCDCFNYFPKYTVVMFGMNDIMPLLYFSETVEDDKDKKREDALNDYEDTLEKIIELCNKNGSIPIICSPTPYDEYSDIPSDNWTANSGLFVRRDIAEKTARKHGLIFVDMHKSIMNYIESRPIGTDRIHPNEFGYHLMAETFMTSVGIKEEFEKDKKVLLSEVNKKRYEIERIIRCIMHVERDTMLWQFEPDKSLDERKRLVGERIEREKLNGFVATGELYLKNIDYIDELRGKLIKITTEMYQ